MSRTKPLLVSLALAAISAASQAAIVTISTDFYGTAPEANRLSPTDVAGAPAYSAANWNVVAGTAIAPASAIALKDSSGSTATGVTLSIANSAAANYIQSFGGSPSTGNAKLYNGAVGRDQWTSAFAFTLRGLDVFQSYEIIAYLEADYGDANRVARITTSAAGSPIYYGHTSVNTLGPSSFTLVTSTSQATPGQGNYMRFADLTDPTLTVTFSAPMNFVYMTGFQVMGVVPEPSSLTILGVGSLAVLRRRRDH